MPIIPDTPQVAAVKAALAAADKHLDDGGVHPDQVLDRIQDLPDMITRLEFFQPVLLVIANHMVEGPQRQPLLNRAKDIFGTRADQFAAAMALADYHVAHQEPFQQLEQALTAGPLDLTGIKLALLPLCTVLNEHQTAKHKFLRDGLEQHLRTWLRKMRRPGAEPDDETLILQVCADVAAAGPAPMDPAELEKAKADARERAAAILYAADPLDEVRRELPRVGWGGDPRPLLLLYLNMTTRVLMQRRGTLTGHSQVNAPAGAGKSFGVDCVTQLLPPSAYEIYDAGSQRVLIYDPASFKHKVLIYREADSLPGVAHGEEDNPAASMLRTLLQDGEASYKTVVKDKETGVFTVQEVRKEGPTVLVVTAVDRIHGQQLDSRLFAIEIPDEVVQKRRALDAQARAELEGGYPQASPVLIALQEYLQLCAPLNVVVPYVRAFNTLLGQSRVDGRLLRDAARILSLIKAVAIIRIAKREVDEHGRLVATYDDYQTACDLLTEVYENTVTEATPKMRLTVQLVEKHPGISLTDLATLLQITKNTLSPRVRKALDYGWLENRGHAQQYRLFKGNTAMPHPTGLPTVAELKAWRPVRTPISDTNTLTP